MKALTLLIGAGLLQAAPALAQREQQAANANPFDKTTSDSARFTPPADREIAERRMRDFAQCVVRGQPAKARALMAAAPYSKEQGALFKSIAVARRGCLGAAGGRLQMKGNWGRGVIAEQIYLLDYPAPVKATPQPSAAFHGERREGLAFYDYADCVVARNARDADAVVRAAPRSDAEKAAYDALIPALSSCMAGQATLRMDRSELRGYLAEALYHQRRGAMLSAASSKGGINA